MEMNKKNIAILETWTENEVDWGTRPDGGSLHLSKEDYKKFINDYWKREKERNPSGKVPHEYSIPDSNLKTVYVSKKIYNQLLKSKDKFGIWILNSQLNKDIKEKNIIPTI